MRRKKLLIILLVLVLLLGGALSGFWYYAKGEVTAGIAQWRDDWRALGGTADFADPPVSGFPLQLSARFTQPLLALSDGQTWRGPPLVTASAWLWDLETIRFQAPGHQELEVPGGELALDTADLDGSIGFAGGLPNRITLKLTQGRLTNRDSGQQLSAEELSFAAGPFTSTERGMHYAIDLDLGLSGVPLPPGTALVAELLGPRLERLHLVGTLRGPLAPQAAPRAAAALWRDGGGVLDLTTIDLVWGDLTLKGSGTLALDEAFRPLGAFSFESAGLLQLVERMDAAGLLDPSAVPAIKTALKALASGQDAEGRDLVTLPITAQEGTLYLGLLPLGPLRPLF